ncbi:MAG: hypothetical protein Q9166_003940 [cf. Caloplaca sp. 2 TL-2023]
MTQPFKFRFANDEDMEEDHLADDDEPHGTTYPSVEEASTVRAVPYVHKLDDVLSTLPSTLSYNTTTVQSPRHGNIILARRELFDIRAQLMAEDNGLADSSAAGLSTDDIQPNIYEGGFKTWECSVDLANYLATNSEYLSQFLSSSCTIVELGAGTALPTLFLFKLLLTTPSSMLSPHRTLILADFNASVLQLATIPNLLLTWALTTNLMPSGSDDLEITDDLLSAFRKSLGEANIHIHAVSGSWGPELASIAVPEPLKPADDVLILASETIYSPASTRVFTETLLTLNGRSEEGGAKIRALVAAKKVYFGVGGGVGEFLGVLKDLGGEGNIPASGQF